MKKNTGHGKSEEVRILVIYYDYLKLSKKHKKTVKISILAGFLIVSCIIYLFLFYNSSEPIKKITLHKIHNKIEIIGYEKVRCTVYNPTSSQGWGNGNVLFDGTKIRKDVSSGYRYIAVSEDLLKKYPIGSYIEVYAFEDSEYYTGLWQVRDKMNSKKRNQIDFLQSDLKMKLRKNYCFIKKKGE